jgi:hypothetical protein
MNQWPIEDTKQSERLTRVDPELVQVQIQQAVQYFNHPQQDNECHGNQCCLFEPWFRYHCFKCVGILSGLLLYEYGQKISNWMRVVF